MGVSFAFEAEILSFIITVEYAYKYKWNNLWIETDSIYVVMAFNSKNTNVPWRFRNRWLWALEYAKSMNNYVSHIYRESNCVADKLASMATHISDGLLWFSAPSSLQNPIGRDLILLPFYRFKNNL